MHIMQTMHFMQIMQNYKIMHFMQGSAFIILPQPLYFWDGLTSYFYSDKIGSSCWQLFISMK